ncbi:EamA family transporter [Saccharothrix yanglingensis]|uniref:EamA family transporter n=1 Tax=Saccharothrix yanglingensis TaxID=659496 RepID=A0ABU0WZF1_9PSEU|nr:EamA family transporter [Saccharothrix yanglingensis]MDQ2583699.1 EamA family transporter [Saccharothrix yanglingensis]
MTALVPTERRGAAVLMVLGSCTSLQVGAALAARLFPAAGPAGATLLRLALAAAVLCAVVRPTLRGWERRHWAAAVLFGLSLAGMNGFFYASIARIPLGVAVTVEFLGPLVLAAALSRRARDLAWVGLAAVGVVALGWSGDGAASGLDPLGVVFALVAGVFWAGYILAGARLGAVVPGQGGLVVGLAVAAVVLLPLGAGGAWHAVGDPQLLLVALGTGVLASVIPYTLELAALRRLPRPVFGVLLSLEPVVATLVGVLLLSQHVGPLTVAAVGLVVVASAGSTLSSRASKPPATSG